MNQQLSYNIWDSIANAYHSIWAHRKIILPMLLVPMVLRVITQFSILTFADDINLLWQSLYHIPALMAEGWLVMGYILLIAHQNPNFIRPYIFSSAKNSSEQRHVLAGMILYTIIGVLFNAYNYALTKALDRVPPFNETSEKIKESVENNAESAQQVLQQTSVQSEVIPLLLGLVGVLFLFRFCWLYIPFILRLPIKQYIVKTHAPPLNAKFFGIWALGVIPLAFVFMIIIGILLSPYQDQPADLPKFMQFSMVIFESFHRMVLAMVQSYIALIFIMHRCYAKNTPKN